MQVPPLRQKSEVGHGSVAQGLDSKKAKFKTHLNITMTDNNEHK